MKNNKLETPNRLFGIGDGATQHLIIEAKRDNVAEVKEHSLALLKAAARQVRMMQIQQMELNRDDKGAVDAICAIDDVINDVTQAYTSLKIQFDDYRKRSARLASRE